MSSRKIGTAILILLLALGFALWTRIYPTIEVRFFERALSSVPSETVSLHGHSYTVSKGEVAGMPIGSPATLPVLQLAYRKALAERDPLMDISGTDPQKLLRAVSDLEATAKSLSSIQTAYQDRIQNDLYPTDFLRAIALLEQDRLAFIADGTDASADAYDAQLSTAMSAYERDLARFRASFTAVVPSSVKQYDTAGSVVSYDSIRVALGTFSRGIARTKEAARNRAHCAEGRIWDCAVSDLALPAVTVPREEAPDGSATSLAKRVRSMYADEMSMPEVKSLPLLALATSSCASNIGSPLFLIRATTRPEHGIASYSYPMYAGDLRLIDTRAQASIPFIAYFAKAGIRYIPAWPIDYYECPTVAQDFGRLRAMQSIIELARTSPLSAYAQDTDASELRRLEAALTMQHTPILERDALAYAQAARSLAEKNALPHEVSARVVSILLEIRDESAQFDTLIEEISRTERGNLYLQRSGVPVALGPTYLFFLRSGVFSLFMEHNPSVTGTHSAPLDQNMVAARAQPYTYYSSLPVSPQIDAEVIGDLMRFSSAHDAAAR